MLLLVSDYLARIPYFFKKFDKKMTNPNIYAYTSRLLLDRIFYRP